MEYSFDNNEKASTDPKNWDSKNKGDRPPIPNGGKLNRRQAAKQKEINEMSKISILQELK